MRVEQKVSIAIGVACAIGLAGALLAIAGTRRLVRNVEWVGHTHEVRAQLQAVSRYTNGAKADLRDYLLTDDSAFVRQHAVSVSAAESAFARAERLTADNAAQQARLGALRVVLDEREISFNRTIALGPAKIPVSGSLAAQLRVGESLSRRIDSIIAAADSAEGMLLLERLHRERSSEWFVALASMTLVGGLIGLAAILWRSIGRDLSGRERAETALRASEAKFSGILDVAVDAIISIDARGTIVHFNRGAHAIFGYTPQDAIGQPLSLLLPARHQATHAGHVAAFGAGSETSRRMGERREIHGRRKNGEEFDAEATISKLVTEDGLLFTAVLRDVTERKRLEASEHAMAMASGDLARSLDYQTTLMTVASLPVPSIGAWSIFDVAEDPDDGGAGMRRLASHHPDSAIDTILRQLEGYVPDDDSPEPCVDVFRTGKMLVVNDLSRGWLEAHCADARQIELFAQLGPRGLLVVPLVDRERTIGVWTIGSSAEHAFDAFDRALAAALAERAALAVQNAKLLLRAQRATEGRDRVMGMVSHDLRNPLAAISMFARQLADEPVPETRQRTIGTNILASVQWMSSLMQDLLDVGSIEAGRLSVEAEPQSPYDLIESSIMMFRERAAQRRVSIQMRVAPSLPLVRADAHRIQQVLGNLIGNALEYTPPDGRITISADRDDRDVVIRVSDTGSGIPAADLPYIFDRFWHARRLSARRGTGLGLAIVQGIVRAHGGRVWAESAVGRGTALSFTLPVHRSDVPSIGTPAAAATTRV